MSDLISRSALIEDIKKQYDMMKLYFPQSFISFLQAQPLVEPVRGEWIYTPTYREYECSNCKSMINLSDDANAHLNFCPQCGADMRKKVTE